MIEANHLKKILEGALFAAGKPLHPKDFLPLFEESERPAPSEINQALESLILDYQDRGVHLQHLANGYCFRVHEDLGPWISRLWEEKPARYTRAFLETLAIIAYRQPITRGEIEAIRGVAVSANIVKTLQERNWIRIVGHKDVPGKPALLATTKEFLSYFNLERLEDLPPLADIKDLDEAAARLDLEALEEEESDASIVIVSHQEEPDEGLTEAV